jgi:hypothetical protein
MIINNIILIYSQCQSIFCRLVKGSLNIVWWHGALVPWYPDILPKDILPKDILPNGHFAERTFCRRTFCRTAVLPNGHFAERTLCRTDSLLKGQLAENRDAISSKCLGLTPI